MEKWKNQFKLWEPLFQKSEYPTIYKELKDLNLSSENNFSSREKALLAYRCLTFLNISSKKNLVNPTPATSKYLVDLYQLSILCCDFVSVEWASIDGDFVTSVFYICRILLSQKKVDEACEIAQFVFRYFEEIPDAKLVYKTNEINVPSKFITVFLHSSTTLSLNSEDHDKLIYLWNTLLSSCEMRIIRVNFQSIVQYFSSFIQMIKKEEFIQREHQLISLMKKFNRGIMLNKDSLQVFLKFLATNVNILCEFSHKNNPNFFLDCLRHAEKTDAITFCENIYRVCSGIFANDNISDMINSINFQFQLLSRSNTSVLNATIYCAAVIIVKLSLGKMAEYTLDETSVKTWFSLILILAQRLMDIDMNDLFAEKKEGNKKIDFGTIAVVLIDMITCCSSIKNLDRGKEEIYEYFRSSQELALKCIKSMDEKRKDQIINFFGASCVNMCKSYLVADLHTQCKGLCLPVLQYYSNLPTSYLTSPKLKLYPDKLVMCLCSNYRSLKMYEDSMKTALAWSLILPSHSNVFMEQYCSAKCKLSFTTPESPYVDYTCLKFLKEARSQWRHKNLESTNSAQICLMELKAYLTNNLILPAAIEDLFRFLKCDHSGDGIILGNVYYAKFRLKLLKFREENTAEVKSLAPNKTDPSNPDNTYVLASYNFNNQKDILNSLDKAVDTWSAAVEKCRSSEPKNCLKELELSYLKEAAFVYRMYCDNTREIDAWKLLYAASKCCENAEMTVYALSNLMCTSWRINCKWVKEVKEQMLEKVDEALQLRYQLDSFNRGFIDGFTSEDKKSLQQITLEQAEKHNLQAKYCFLMARIYFHKVLEYTADPFIMCFNAISNSMLSLKSVKWNQNFADTCELECLLLDASVFMIARCVEKFEPQNAEVFAEEPFKLVQTMGLPLRTCQLLNVSAFVDTLVGRLEDCFVKLQYASNILNHNITPTTKMYSKPETYPVVSTDLRFVSSDYDIDFEENPAMNSQLQFESPEFVSHLEKCGCHICMNGEYLRLYCELMSLYGIYFRLLKKWSQADRFFDGVLNKLLKCAKKRISINELKASTLIQCGFYWAAQNCFKEAKTCNEKVLKMVYANQLANPALKEIYADQHWQLFAVKFFEEIEKSRSVKEPKEIVKINFLEKPEPRSMVKKLQKAVKCAPITPLPRKSRKILLFEDFSESSTPPSEKVDKENALFTTPPASVMELPSTVKTRRRKPLNSPPPSEKAKENKLFITPPSSVMELPSTVQTRRRKPPPSEKVTEENKLSTTPPASVMELPSTVQKRRGKRRL